jgi:hypothetical protein
MRRVIVFVVLAAVVAIGVADWRASAAGLEESVLANAGFEAGSNTVADIWKSFGKNAAREGVTARSGIYSGKAFGEFSGQPNFAGFLQNYEASPGQQWVASVWIRQNTDDPLTGQCEAFAKIEFYDKTGGFIDAMESADRVSSTSAKDQFVRSSVLSVAPPLTATVRFVAMFAQFDGKSKGSVYFDDGELHAVVPTEPAQ